MHTRTRKENALICRIRELSAPLPPISTGIPTKAERMDGVRAVVFDVYGTLFVSGSGDIDAAGASPAAFHDALARAGFRPLKTDCAAHGLAMFAEAILLRHRVLKASGVEYPEVDIREIWRDGLTAMQSGGYLAGEITPDAVMRLAVEYECRANPVWPMPGMEETLDRLRAAGIRLGIVSNAQFYTPLLFDALLGRSLAQLGFEPALTVWSYQALEAKPSPRLFAALTGEAGRRLGLRPPEMLFVGNDMLKDVFPARAAGLRTALFAGDERSLRKREDRPECRAMAPDWILGELPGMLPGLGLAENP